MFKKIASIALAAMMIGSTAVVVGAAEKEEGVAAADDSSAVAAADESAVGADEGSEATGAGSKIYFDANSTGWNNYKKIYFYLYDHANGEIITWGSKKGMMTDEGGGIWSYDLADKGLSLGTDYGCIFSGDWNQQTCDLILGPDSVGDTAYCTGNKVENNVDSNKKSDEVKWKSGKYGNPVCVTSIGNVIGDAYWSTESAYSVFVKFLSSTGKDGIDNAKNFTGKDDQTIVTDTAAALGLSNDEVAKAIKESGRDIKWTAPGGGGSETTPGETPTTTGDSDGNGNSGGTTGGSSSGSSSSGSSSSGSGTTGSVTSGEESTIYFILGGVMLAAVGVFFLARKRREY